MSFVEIKKGAEKIEDDLTKQRDERCVPAAQDLLVIVAKARISAEANETVYKEYVPLIREVQDVFMKHKIRISDVNYVFRLLMQPVSVLGSGVEQTLNKACQLAIDNFWGKPEEEVTVEELDNRLKTQ